MNTYAIISNLIECRQVALLLIKDGCPGGRSSLYWGAVVNLFWVWMLKSLTSTGLDEVERNSHLIPKRLTNDDLFSSVENWRARRSSVAFSVWFTNSNFTTSWKTCTRTNFLCYLNDPESTSKAVDADGWYHSGSWKNLGLDLAAMHALPGDIGQFDPNYNLWIVDRLKEVIKYKGYVTKKSWHLSTCGIDTPWRFQVGPAELEAILCASPLVKDAAVTSIYSPSQATELPKAYIVPADQTLIPSMERRPTIAQLKLVDKLKSHVEAHTAKYKWWVLENLSLSLFS
jgi:hypothetical protein